MSHPQQSYQILLQKIRDLGQQQDQIYRDQLHCQKGCFACCHPPDSLFQVEAETLVEGIAQLEPAQKQRIRERLTQYRQDSSLLCPLLEEGACTVYKNRPSICRTQGYALWLKSEVASLSWCPLNFLDAEPEQRWAFDVERLNAMLSLITRLGWPDQPPRRELVEIIESGLASPSTY